MGPIGVFDSGYGGLTVLKHIRKYLPQYDYLYLGDNARAPYGAKSFDVVYEYTLEAVKELFNWGCELVILACNTASAKALRTIQQNDLPKIAPEKRVLGVLRPTTEIITNFSDSGYIGILATDGTVKSNSYPIEIYKFAPHVKVIQQSCPLWVPLIESNEHLTEEGSALIKKDVLRLLNTEQNIDTILLACTHYPLIKPLLESFIPPDITIVDQGEIVAKSLTDYLKRHPWIDSKSTKNGSVHYLTTEIKEEFDKNASFYLGEEVYATQVVIHHV